MFVSLLFLFLADLVLLLLYYKGVRLSRFVEKIMELRDVIIFARSSSILIISWNVFQKKHIKNTQKCIKNA